MALSSTLLRPLLARTLWRRRLRSALAALGVGVCAAAVLVGGAYVTGSGMDSARAMLPQVLLVLSLLVLVYHGSMRTLAARAADAAQQARLEQVIDSVNVGMWEQDNETGLFHVSESWLRMLGRSADAPRTMTLREWRALIHPDDATVSLAVAVAGARGREGLFQVDHRLQHDQGHWIWVAARGRVLEYRADGTPRVLVGTHIDITARKHTEAQLQEAAHTDRLTGLANRSCFVERLRQAVTEGSHGPDHEYAVLFLDFDRFKVVNDAMGHQAGDALLVQVAQRLHAFLAGPAARFHGNHLVARFGGDEFTVLLDGLGLDARRVGDCLLEELARPYVIDGREMQFSASIGIVRGIRGGEDADALLRNADVAMYEAKHAGRARCVVFDDAMHVRLSRRLLVETSLRRAVGTTQFSLVYQPIVELATGRCASVEALLRWEHPLLGRVSPEEFIPVAEDCSIVSVIGDWVMREACAMLARWRAQDPRGAPATVSVNVSRMELAQGRRLLDSVRAALAATGLPAQCLMLEVTEREVMRDPVAVHEMMNALHQIGVHLAMDDFGTGMSSLACLRDYPFDVIKIDRAFTARLDDGPDTLAVIHATVTLVENLGRTSVAEGVETAEQLAILQSLGCHFAQGYYLGRPVGAQHLLAPAQENRIATA